MPPTPAETFAVRLENPRRARWKWVIVVFLVIGIPLVALPVAMTLKTLTGQVWVGVVGVIGWMGCAIGLGYCFEKWLSDAATVIIGRDRLAITTGPTRTVIRFEKIEAHYNNTYRGRYLEVVLRDGTRMRLRPGADKAGFDRMTDLFEARWRADLLRP